SIGPFRRMSMRTRSGLCEAARSMAEGPVPTMPTTVYPRRRSVAARSMATIVSSSTMRIRASGIGPSSGWERHLEFGATLPRLHDDRPVDLLYQPLHQLQAECLGLTEIEAGRKAHAVVAHRERDQAVRPLAEAN